MEEENVRLKSYECRREGCAGELVWDGVAWSCFDCEWEIIVEPRGEGEE